MSPEMCVYIHHSIIIGISVEYLLKYKHSGDIPRQFINDMHNFTQPIQIFDRECLLNFMSDMQWPTRGDIGLL